MKPVQNIGSCITWEGCDGKGNWICPDCNKERQHITTPCQYCGSEARFTYTISKTAIRIRMIRYQIACAIRLFIEPLNTIANKIDPNHNLRVDLRCDE